MSLRDAALGTAVALAWGLNFVAIRLGLDDLPPMLFVSLRFLLAAQPTRGLDVGAVQAVYGHIRAAADRGVGVLLISSELDELLSVADRVLVLYRGHVMGSCPTAGAERARIGAWMAGHREEEVAA